MASYDYDIGIIGGGAAGLTVAAGCAQVGAKTIVVEKEAELGGDCLHYGCVPSKTLVHTARVYHLLGQTRSLGLPALDVPPVDFKRIARRIREVIEQIQKHDSRERFCKLGAAVHTGKATFADEHQIILEDGTRLSADKWVVATGSSPARPDVPGLDEVDFLTNRDLFSLESLPQSMIILGGGPIAVEMAQAFARLGTRVTIIQRSAQLLSREDPDMAAIITRCLEEEGVLVRTGLAIARVSAEDQVIRVKARDGQGKNLLFEAEKLLVALGRTPNIMDLGLDQAGVDYTSKGINVDQRLRTSQSHIYAAGDVTGRFLFTHAAGYEGGIVVSNAAFHLPRKVDYTFMPWCTYTDPELAGIGYTENQARANNIQYRVITETFAANDRSLAENNTTGLLKLVLDSKDKPIGVQIIGPHAGELLGEWVAFFNAGMKLSTLAASVHPYPTLGEINKRVAGSYLAPKIFSKTVSRALTFFFQFKGRACPLPEDN
ncbi:dihydrolipoyl dehydrogenase family protein [Desulfoplanes formicivorans]|uniref:Mercuric reductase n=1 Tax=Desulfoplanes formicivorans TaxID=1592317 RepID=A0A194AKI5_9BACT|nr:FAD-dependent oxidoreductase [Desulfoplanes formicivorans]GAU09224.1 mercuric reductase [Desulfoplanes formicivorans]